MFGGTHVIKKFSLYDRLYTLNLTRIPSDLDDDATLLLVEWHGASGPGHEEPPLSVTGERALHPEGRSRT